MAQPTTLWRRLLLAVAAAGLLSFAAPAGARRCSTQVVCRWKMIVGCEAEYAQAARHLGPATTSNPARASVYLTLADIDPLAGSTDATLYLQAIPVARGRVKIVPLVLDSAAARRIADLPRENVLDFDPAAGDLEAAIRQQAGDVLVLLGHVDEQAGEYQVHSRSGTLLRRFALADVERWSQSHQTVVIPLGCHSAMFARSGAAVRFNALYALERFAGALKAETLLDFLQALGGEKLLLVVDEAALRRTSRPEAVSVFKIDAFPPDSAKPTGTIRAYVPFGARPGPTPSPAAIAGPSGDSRSADEGTVLLMIGLGIILSGGVVASVVISRSRA